MDIAPFAQFLTSTAVQAPRCLVWLVGGILAVILWRRHHLVSILTISALLLAFVVAVLRIMSDIWLPSILRISGNTGNIGQALTIADIVLFIVEAIAWGLLLVAVFGWRRRRESNPPERAGLAERSS